jgi:hypothetical protein
MKKFLKIAGLAYLIGISAFTGAAYALERGEPGYCQAFPDDAWCVRLPLPDGGAALQPPAPPPPPAVHPNDVLRTKPRVDFDVYIGDGDRRDFRDDEREERPLVRRVRFCTNTMAINKARRLGVRSIRAYAYPDYVLIKGRQGGNRVEVAFGRHRTCPILDY